jgi:DNA-binding response OmpR family regulator
VKQCSVLVINISGTETRYRLPLERVGFRVVETGEWPEDEMIRSFEVVIVLLRDMKNISMMAARLRAKPYFGQRVLIAVAIDASSMEDRRTLIGCGFDDVLNESHEPRLVIARILRQLRARPEHRCFLPDLKRRAA